MSFFDEMKESLVSAGKDVSQKAKEVSGVAKLKLDVKSKEDYVEKMKKHDKKILRFYLWQEVE